MRPRHAASKTCARRHNSCEWRAHDLIVLFCGLFKCHANCPLMVLAAHVKCFCWRNWPDIYWLGETRKTLCGMRQLGATFLLKLLDVSIAGTVALLCLLFAFHENAPKQRGLKERPIHLACPDNLRASLKLRRCEKAQNVMRTTCSLYIC